MPKTAFISSKPENWETPFPIIGEVIRAIANVMETKSNSPNDIDKLARGDIFDYDIVDRLWEEAFNLPLELKFGKIKEVINDIRENLLKEYIGILREGISCGYSRENIMECLNKKIAHIVYYSIDCILEGQDELLHDFVVSDNPIHIAFKHKYYENWEKFRKTPPTKAQQDIGYKKIIDNVYRWMEENQNPKMDNLLDVIKAFCDEHEKEKARDNIYKVFFCAKIIYNIKLQYPQISHEFQNIDNGKDTTDYEPLERTLYYSCKDKEKLLTQKNINRFGEYNTLYKQTKNELYRKSHRNTDKEKLGAGLEKLEKITKNLQDLRVCWWNTQGLRAYWYVLSGEWEQAKECYEEIIDILFYTGEKNLEEILKEALVLASIQEDRPLLKKLKHRGVVFGFFGMPYTNRSNFDYSNANKESRTKDFIVEDSEVKTWASEFYNIFPKDRFFISEADLPKPVENPLILTFVDGEIPKEADLKKKNKFISIKDKKYPPLVFFTEQGNIQEVKKLLEAGVDVNQLSSSSESALLFAIREMDITLPGPEKRNIEFFEILSEYPHKIETLEILTNKRHLSILGSAVETGNPKIVKKVLEMMKKVNAKIDIKYGGDDMTPLYKTIQLFANAKFKDVLQNPQSFMDDKTFEFMRRQNPFLAGITTEQTKQMFKQIMSNPLVKQSMNFTSEWIAGQYQKQYKKEHLLEITKLLLEAKSNPNEPHISSNGKLRDYTPLMFAAELDLVDVFDLLIKAGGEVKKPCEYIHNVTGELKKIDCKQVALSWNSNKVLKYMQENC